MSLICNALAQHESVEHGHETHGHSTTVSAGHEHMVEESKGTYPSVKGDCHHKLFGNYMKEKKKLFFVYFYWCNDIM